MEKYVEVSAVKEFAGTFLCDPILEMTVNAVLDHAPTAEVPQLSSAEKQAIFRLGQMDMRDSMAAMLRDEAARSKGMVKSDFMAAADLIAEREIP